MADMVRKDDFLSSGRVQYHVTRSGLVGATLNGVQVLSGSFGPVNCDQLFNAADVADKVGSVQFGLMSTYKDRCVLIRRSDLITVSEDWAFGDEDATVRIDVTNRDPAPIRYPGYGDLTVSWPTHPTAGVTTGGYWNAAYLQTLGRAALSPSWYIRLRACWLADTTVGIGICPLDLGDERFLPLWQAVGDQEAVYTKRWFRCIWDRAILPGATATMRFTIRVSDNVDVKHLLAPYQAVVGKGA